MRRLMKAGIVLGAGMLLFVGLRGDLVANRVIAGASWSIHRAAWAMDGLASRLDGMLGRASRDVVRVVERRVERAEARIAERSDADSDEFRWTGRVDPGDVVEIKGVNGEVSAEPASGDEVEVVAVKSARKSDPRDVRIEVVEHSGGVTVCAVYPGDRSNECAPGSKGEMNVRNNDVNVEFEVRVPDGIGFVGRTVNGDVEAEGLTGNVIAHTVNGDVSIQTAGYAEATTVNGSIEAAIGQGGWEGPMKFTTVNGSISLDLPQEIDAEVDAKFMNGGLETDLPLRLEGKLSPRRAVGTLGSGGPMLELSTVNGEIELRSHR